MSLTEEEFLRLQGEILALKAQKYEWEAREDRLSQEIKTWRSKAGEAIKRVRVLRDVVEASEQRVEVARLLQENKVLKDRLRELSGPERKESAPPLVRRDSRAQPPPPRRSTESKPQPPLPDNPDRPTSPQEAAAPSASSGADVPGGSTPQRRPEAIADLEAALMEGFLGALRASQEAAAPTPGQTAVMAGVADTSEPDGAGASSPEDAPAASREEDGGCAAERVVEARSEGMKTLLPALAAAGAAVVHDAVAHLEQRAQDAEAQLQAATASAESLQAQLDKKADEHEQEVKKHQLVIEDITQRTNVRVRQELAAVTAKFEEEKQVLTVQLQRYRDENGQLSARVKDFEETVTARSRERDLHKLEAERLKKDTISHTNKSAQLAAQVASLTAELEQSQTRALGLEGEVTALQNGMKTLRQEVAALKGDAGTSAGELQRAEAALHERAAQLDGATARIAELEAALAAKERETVGAAASLQAEVSAKQAEIEDLSKRLEEEKRRAGEEGAITAQLRANVEQLSTDLQAHTARHLAEQRRDAKMIKELRAALAKGMGKGAAPHGEKSDKPDIPPANALMEENEKLVQRMVAVQSEKWALEEKLTALEMLKVENTRLLERIMALQKEKWDLETRLRI